MEAQHNSTTPKGSSMRRIVIVLVILAGMLGPLTASADPAMAANCTGDDGWPYFSWTRTDNQVYGIRAPIQSRIDGGLCGVAGGGDNPSNAIGILIEDASSHVGIGYVHEYGVSGGHYCRFWDSPAGGGPTYDCGTTDDQFVFFKIVRYFDSVHHVYKYEIDDCGTAGGYGNCTAEDSTSTAFSNPAAETQSNSNFTCTIHIMGSSSDKQNIGTSNNPLQCSTDDGSSWSTRSWGGPHWSNNDSSCSTSNGGPYGVGSDTSSNSYWDTRNL
jgi:hypothetical protein